MTTRTSHQLAIREERVEDMDAVRELNRRAFGQAQESKIVDALRTNGAAILSLVATLNDQVVGHIMYSSAVIDGSVRGAALGPMAVLPEYQRQGVGSKLIEAGNWKLKDAGCPFIIVVGHAELLPPIRLQTCERARNQVRMGCSSGRVYVTGPG